MSTILVIDDEPETRNDASRVLTSFGYSVETLADGTEVLKQIKERSLPLHRYSAILLDLRMNLTGQEILQEMKRSDQIKTAPIIILTAVNETKTAMECLDMGAWDYCLKNPIHWDDIHLRIECAIRTFQRLRHAENERERIIDLAQYFGFQLNDIQGRSPFPEIIGNSPAMLGLYSQINKVSPSDVTVLLKGESGTGKELVARQIHKSSQRSSKAFIAVNCGSLSENLLESELFGHEKGAFTGAMNQRVGRFEFANGGTLFLDEITETSLKFQVKLLRILQERQFERVGSNVTRSVDVRVITATNKNIEALVKEMLFREDLFYRLNVFPILIPPLKDRLDDLALLIRHFVSKKITTVTNETPIDQVVTPDCVSAMKNYGWKGNVRELDNFVERAMIDGGNRLPLRLAWFPVLQTFQQRLKKQNERLFTECEHLKPHEQWLLINTMLHSGRWGTDSTRRTGSTGDKRGLVSYLKQEFDVESEERGTTLNWIRVGKQQKFLQFQSEFLTKYGAINPEEGEHKNIYLKRQDAIRRAVIAADFLLAAYRQRKTRTEMLKQLSYPNTPLTDYDVSNRMNLTTLRLLGIIDSPPISYSTVDPAHLGQSTTGSSMKSE